MITVEIIYSFSFNSLFCYSLVPSVVQEALVTLVNGEVNVTWSPPAVPNGEILQYVVQRINASGKFFEHVPANQYTMTLPYYNDVLVFIAAINLYGQSQFIHAEPKGIGDNVCYSIVV